MKNIYRFDNKNFNIEELRTYINNNKKLLSLYNNLRKIIYVNNFIGVNELIAGLLAETLGYYFLQGALIQLVFRISIYLGCLFNYLLYFVLKLKKIK